MDGARSEATRSRPALGRRGPRIAAAMALLALVLAACSGAPAGSPAVPSPQVASEAPSATTSVPASPSDAAASPSDAAAASPSSAAASAPVLDPERCPPTLPEPDLVTDDGTAIEGDEAFVDHVQQTLAVLAKAAPDAYADVVANVTRIRQVDSFSGMCDDTGTYRVGEETAHAPGHPIERQRVWLAGTIVHDGCHRARYVAGQEPSGKDAELACLKLQEAALRKLEDTFLADYVEGLIDGADDPANQYWNDPNRHW